MWSGVGTLAVALGVGLGVAALAMLFCPLYSPSKPFLPTGKETATPPQDGCVLPDTGKETATPRQDGVSYLMGKETATPPLPRATARVPSPHQPYPRPYKDYEELMSCTISLQARERCGVGRCRTRHALLPWGVPRLSSTPLANTHRSPTHPTATAAQRGNGCLVPVRLLVHVGEP